MAIGILCAAYLPGVLSRVVAGRKDAARHTEPGSSLGASGPKSRAQIMTNLSKGTPSGTDFPKRRLETAEDVVPEMVPPVCDDTPATDPDVPDRRSLPSENPAIKHVVPRPADECRILPVEHHEIRSRSGSDEAHFASRSSTAACERGVIQGAADRCARIRQQIAPALHQSLAVLVRPQFVGN